MITTLYEQIISKSICKIFNSQLSDVEAGGATVFIDSGTISKPSKVRTISTLLLMLMICSFKKRTIQRVFPDDSKKNGILKNFAISVSFCMVS